MRKITSIFLTTLQLQLFLNIISLIIIAHWGLSLSCIAPLSNIIFSPLLTAFLLLSSLIFFLELFYIPNNCLIYLLELLTNGWSSIMSLANRSLIINVSKPSTFFTLCIIIITGAILQSKHLHSPIRRIIAFALLLAGILLHLKYTQLPQHDHRTIPLGKKELSVLYAQGTLCIIDNGTFGQQACTKSWIEFTLLPLLRQTYATDIISHLIALRPTVKTFQSISELCTSTTVKNVYIPYWQGDTPRNLARAYFSARTSLEKEGTLHRIDNKNRTITLNATSSLELAPQKKQSVYRTIRFPNIQVQCTLANKDISEEA